MGRSNCILDSLVKITSSQFEELKAHSLSCYPEEACALLVGREDRVEEIFLAQNIAENRRRFFEVDPTVRIRVEKKCRGSDQSIIGIFHSHPDGEPRPSKTDAAMVIETHFCWLIAALNTDGAFEIGAFMPLEKGAGFEATSLIIEEK